jgi:hypothetical protein
MSPTTGERNRLVLLNVVIGQGTGAVDQVTCPALSYSGQRGAESCPDLSLASCLTANLSLPRRAPGA